MEGHSMTPLRVRQSWLAAAMVPVAAFGVACGGNQVAAPPKVIFDKGTPFADLLVPKLTSSVTDGAVGYGAWSLVWECARKYRVSIAQRPARRFPWTSEDGAPSCPLPESDADCRNLAQGECEDRCRRLRDGSGLPSR